MFRIFMARLLVLLFVLLVLPVSFLWTLSNTYLNREFLLNDFVDFTYDFFELNARDYLKNEEFKNISNEELMLSFRKIFSKEDFRNTIDLTLNETVKSLKNVRNEKIEIKISLAGIVKKKPLMAEELANLLYDNITKCKNDSLVATVDSLNNLHCIPSDMSEQDFKYLVRRFLNRDLFSKFPNEISFDFSLPKGVEGDLLGYAEETINWLYLAAILFLALDLFLLAIVIMGSWNEILRWELKPIMISSFLMIIFSIFLYYFPEILRKILGARNDLISIENLNTLTDSLEILFEKLIVNLLKFATPIFLISSCIWIYCIYHSGKIKAGKI